MHPAKWLIQVVQKHQKGMRCHPTDLDVYAGALKMTDMKLQDMKMTDQVAGHENARHENAGQTMEK